MNELGFIFGLSPLQRSLITIVSTVYSETEQDEDAVNDVHRRVVT